MPRKPLTAQERVARMERNEQRLNTFNKVMCGTLALGGVVYFASREGAKRGCADFSLAVLEEMKAAQEAVPTA